jgi:hypothetical protein
LTYAAARKRIDVPTLFFADPWGYEGVSIDLIEAALSHWGSDFLFFPTVGSIVPLRTMQDKIRYLA